MNIITKPTFYLSLFCITLGQNCFAADSELLQTVTKETQQTKNAIILAEVFRGIDRRMDRRDNEGDRQDRRRF